MKRVSNKELTLEKRWTAFYAFYCLGGKTSSDVIFEHREKQKYFPNVERYAIVDVVEWLLDLDFDCSYKENDETALMLKKSPELVAKVLDMGYTHFCMDW